MTKRQSLSDMVETARRSKFSLPEEITYQKTQLASDIYAYVYRHHELGQIGRMVIIPHPNGSQWIHEVAGHPDDPMTTKRREIFEPIASGIINTMRKVCDVSAPDLEPSYTLQQEPEIIIKTETMTCNKCGTTVGIIFMAPDAHTADRLEDYARMTFTKIKELNVPAWIVGAETEVSINGDVVGEALVLKVWPKREAAKIIPSIELNPIFSLLAESHC